IWRGSICFDLVPPDPALAGGPTRLTLRPHLPVEKSTSSLSPPNAWRNWPPVRPARSLRQSASPHECNLRRTRRRPAHDERGHPEPGELACRAAGGQARDSTAPGGAGLSVGGLACDALNPGHRPDRSNGFVTLRALRCARLSAAPAPGYASA